MDLTNRFSDHNRTSYETQSSSVVFHPVKVLEVILDPKDDRYDSKLGENNFYGIGAIRFAPYDQDVQGDNIGEIAFPLSNQLKTLPLKNEIVLVTKSPYVDWNREDRKNTTQKYYYVQNTVVNLWRNPNANPYALDPNSETDNQTPDDLGYNFSPNDNLKQLQPFNGDTILEGRFGHSIRFSGAESPLAPLVDTPGSPYISIVNGHAVGEDNLHYIENINEDLSSIYITANHTVPLEQSVEKFKATATVPTFANEYTGNQIVVNSGRLFFNTTEESMVFTTPESFNVSSKIASIDAEEAIGFDAKKIYLGKVALKREKEPVIKGDQLELLLDNFLQKFESLCDKLGSAKTIDGKIIPNLNAYGKITKPSVKKLRNRINPGGKSQLKSNKVFTE